MTVRVLRVIEYEYRDLAAYLEDCKRWTVQLSAEEMSMSSSIVRISEGGGTGSKEASPR